MQIRVAALLVSLHVIATVTFIAALVAMRADQPQARPAPSPSSATLPELLVGPGECLELMGTPPPGSPRYFVPRFVRCVTSSGIAVTCTRGDCKLDGRDA